MGARSRGGQPGKYSQAASRRPQANPSTSVGESPMSMAMRVRVVMEWLGLLQPDPSRREPAAVPAWAPYVIAASVALATGAIALITTLILRALAS
jgi:hypothetical protein